MAKFLLALVAIFGCAVAAEYPGLLKSLQSSLLEDLEPVVQALVSDDEPEYAPVIQTKYGKIRGLIERPIAAKGSAVHLYQGIRFGKAKRFERPEPVEPWTDIYDATKPRQMCPQAPGSVPESEDCLFLNIWKPANATNLPVMFWIYGGAFQFGSIFEPFYNGSLLASRGQVIFVSVNYRLGPFGFLYAKDAAKGNQGLFDQLLGLKWVQENIQQFGGDPKQVTIFGESAGSMSVGAMINSPLTNGLFHRAILESGYPIPEMGAGPMEDAWNNTLNLAKYLKCNQTEPKQVVECLRKKSIEEIKTGSHHMGQYREMTPVYGDEFLPISPDNLSGLSKRLTNKSIDLIFGTTHDEGSLLISLYYPRITDDNGHFTMKELQDELIGVMNQFRVPKPQEVFEFYTKNLDASNLTEVRLALSKWFGEWIIVCPTLLFGKEMAKTYGKDGKHFYNYRLDDVSYRQKNWRGVVHASDVPLVFGLPLMIPTFFPESDQRMSSDIIDAWTGFAHTGRVGKMGKLQWLEALETPSSNNLRYFSLAPEYHMMTDGQQDFLKNCENIWRNRIFK